MNRSSLLLPAIALLLVALSVTASAAGTTSPQYDVAIWSSDFQPGNPVYINVTGPANMSVNIIVLDNSHNIVGGRDVELDTSGFFAFAWTPTSEGTYNVTVSYSIGITISRSFLVQQRVTQADLSRIWNAIYSGIAQLGDRIDSLDSKVNIGIGVGVVSFIFAGLMFNHVRTHYSRADSEFQKFMKQDVDTAVGRLLKQQKKEEEEPAEAEEEG